MTPRRTCIGCRRSGDTDQLVRVVRRGDGSLLVGRTWPGRGAWLCRDRPECVDLAERKRAFERALRGPVARVEVAGLRNVLRTGLGGGPSEASEEQVL